MRSLIFTGIAAALFAFSSAPTFAAEIAAAPNGVKLTKYIIGVADLDKSYAFYHALGIELAGNKKDLGKPAPLADMIRNLVDVPTGTKFRNAMLTIPGADFALEMTEFSDITLHAGRPRMTDPGASLLILIVRDAGAALAAAKKAGAEVVTLGGAPLGVGANNANKAVFVKDPDSFYVELLQPATLPVTTAPAGSNIIGARFATVVADAEKAAQFYRDKFGLEAKVDDWITSGNMLKVVGMADGQRRNATVSVPGSSLTWSFFEFKTSGSTSYKLRIPDPGAPAIGFQVRDLTAAATTMKTNGGSVITVGSGLKTPDGGSVAFTRDPNGVLVEIAQTGK